MAANVKELVQRYWTLHLHWVIESTTSSSLRRTAGKKRSSPSSSGRRSGAWRAWRSGICSFRMSPATARLWGGLGMVGGFC